MPSSWRRRWNFSTRSTISSLATAITKLSSVSRSAMVETDDGKNCGVSAGHDEAVIGGADDRAGRAVGEADDGQALFAGDLTASTTSVR
jgi:hypothetical protein